MAQTNFTAGDMYPKAVKPVVVSAPAAPKKFAKKAEPVVEAPVVEETSAEEISE
jgi:hypothetical protein